MAVKVGANSFLLKPTHVDTLLTYEHARHFKGSNAPAILKWSYSHDPTRENAVLGFIDPSQTDRPQLILSLQTSGPTLNYATIDAAATADIGINSALVVDVLAFTKNRLHFDNFLIRVSTTVFVFVRFAHSLTLTAPVQLGLRVKDFTLNNRSMWVHF